MFKFIFPEEVPIAEFKRLAHLIENDERLDAMACLLYTSDAADERSSVDLGGRRIIKKKKTTDIL